MDSQVPFATMHFPDGYGHFQGQHQRSGAREQAQHQHQAAKHFQHAGDINEISRQAMFHEESLHIAAQVRELGVSMSKEDDAEREAQRQ